MTLLDLVKKSRSYRRFDSSRPVPRQTLEDLIRLAQYSPTGSNRQPLKFWLSHTPEMNAAIFPHLSWAGALKDWDGPSEGQRPSAYILILGDKEISTRFGVDYGIAAQSIMLGAAEVGLGGCMLGSVKRKAVQVALAIPDRYEILLVLALGWPAEKVVTELVPADGEVTYYRDPADVHHVPKRRLVDLILNN